MLRFKTLIEVAKAALLVPFVGLLLLPVGCAVSAGGAASSPVQKEAAAKATGAIPGQFFGMVVKDPAVRPTVVAGARRLWDSGVTWAALEPERGSFAWAALDAEVAAAEQAGAEVTLTLGMTPEWASSNPGAASSYGAGATAMPAALADWDAYVAAVAARYRGRIAAYEVWNAPEDPAYWSGNPGRMGADMAMLAAHAAVAVHTFDPAAKLVSPVMSPSGSAAFLAAGGGASVDAIGAALVVDGQAPEALAGVVQALRSTMAGTEADGKPLWGDGGSWMLPEGGLDQTVQAAYAARALVLGAGYAVGRMHWYAWDASGAGALALTDGNKQPTAAARAYAQVESWLVGSRMNGCAATAEGVWTCQLVQGGQTAWIVWSAGEAARVSGMGAATVTDLEGTTTAVGANGSVQVGASPVLLR